MYKCYLNNGFSYCESKSEKINLKQPITLTLSMHSFIVTYDTQIVQYKANSYFSINSQFPLADLKMGDDY